MNAVEHIKRWAKMKSGRMTLDSHLQEVIDYVAPARGDITRMGQEGEKRGITLYDSTAGQSAELLAGTLAGMLSNADGLWFEPTTGIKELDDRDDVRAWFQHTTRAMHTVMAGSNFKTESHMMYFDQTWAGNSPFYTMEDEETIVRYHARHIKEVHVEENHLGIVDTVYRSWKWNLRQICLEYGEEALSEKMRKQYEKDPSKEYTLLQAIYPRKGAKGKGGPENWPIASDHLCVEEKHELKTGGFKEMPVAFPRWTKMAGETYGRSPAQKALPEVKMVNKMVEALIRSAQKAIDPPLMVPHDSFIMPVKTTPGSFTYRKRGRADERIEPFGHEGKIQFGLEMIEATRNIIQKCFYYDQMKLREGDRMTTVEVMQRSEETLRFMGPMLGRMESEFLYPVLGRTFNIIVRHDEKQKEASKLVFRPSPEVLAGRDIYFRYTSQIAKAQRMNEVTNFQRAVATISPIAQVQPQVMDNLNGDEAFRFIMNVTGVPQSLMHDRDVVEQQRQQRAEKEAEAEQIAKQSALAEAVGQAGPTLLEANQAGVV